MAQPVAFQPEEDRVILISPDPMLRNSASEIVATSSSRDRGQVSLPLAREVLKQIRATCSVATAKSRPPRENFTLVLFADFTSPAITEPFRKTMTQCGAARGR